MKRMRLNRKKSRRLFKKGASRVHRKNTKRPVFRGGIRL